MSHRIPSNHVDVLDVLASTLEPIGSPRTSRLDRNFRVASGDATVSVGEIHDASPTPSTKLVLGVPTATTGRRRRVLPDSRRPRSRFTVTRRKSTTTRRPSTPCPRSSRPTNDLTCGH